MGISPFKVWHKKGVYKGINCTKPIYSGVLDIQTELKMNIREAKSISLVSFMERMGSPRMKADGDQYWYKSPLHRDETPSFKVNTSMNLWYDFGLGIGGDIIDLGKKLFRTEHVSEVLRILGNKFCGSVPKEERTVTDTEGEKHMKALRNLEIMPLQHCALRSYLTTRSIDLLLASEYCNEAHYNIRDRKYFALAFKNDSGGFELRNPVFKGTFGPKDVSHIVRSDDVSSSCCVFEGFMDFLSYMTLMSQAWTSICVSRKSDYIVLNSVNMLQKALPKMERYSEIHCYLDHDRAGRIATDTIAGIFNVTDESEKFAGFNDLNDWLCHRRQNESLP